MNTLRQAVQEYLSMRRNLGFGLRKVGHGLLDFVTFMEQHRASYITRRWRLTGRNNPKKCNRRSGPNDCASCADLRGIAVRPIHARRFHRRAYCRSGGSGRDRTCTRMMRSNDYCVPPSKCHAAIKAVSCDLGSTIVCSGY
jgi:hypothetical protein